MWIRSQDRMQLVKVSAVSITYDDGQPRRIIGYERDRTWVLARYKSGERALEVLTEMQNLLQPKIMVNTCLDAEKEEDMIYFLSAQNIGKAMPRNRVNLDCLPINNIVYEMPKE